MKECENPRCEHGWIKSADDYGEKVYPGPTAEQLGRLSDEDRVALEIHTSAIQQALSDSMYPCKICRPAQFWRWQGGHWRSNHDRSSCDECNPKGAKTRSAVMDPPPHTDSDWGRQRADLR